MSESTLKSTPGADSGIKADISKASKPSQDEKQGSDFEIDGRHLFSALNSSGKDHVEWQDITAVIQEAGLSLKDIRLQESFKDYHNCPAGHSFNYSEFMNVCRPNIFLLERILVT